jgi:hypothetical protein
MKITYDAQLVNKKTGKIANYIFEVNEDNWTVRVLNKINNNYWLDKGGNNSIRMSSIGYSDGRTYYFNAETFYTHLNIKDEKIILSISKSLDDAYKIIYEGKYQVIENSIDKDYKTIKYLGIFDEELGNNGFVDEKLYEVTDLKKMNQYKRMKKPSELIIELTTCDDINKNSDDRIKIFEKTSNMSHKDAYGKKDILGIDRKSRIDGGISYIINDGFANRELVIYDNNEIIYTQFGSGLPIISSMKGKYTIIDESKNIEFNNLDACDNDDNLNIESFENINNNVENKESTNYKSYLVIFLLLVVLFTFYYLKK